MPAKTLKVVVAPHVEAQIEHWARRENRTTSGMLNTLIIQALDSRRQATREITSLVSALKSEATP